MRFFESRIVKTPPSTPGKLLTLIALAASLAIPATAATEWTFNTPGDLQGWQPAQHLEGAAPKDGTLTALTAGEDPIFLSPDIKVTAKEFQSVTVRMRLQGANGSPIGDQGVVQLFWRTSSEASESEEASVRVNTAGDGQWHDYTFAVEANGHWKDTVTGLRLDPCNSTGVKVSINSIRLLSKSATPSATPKAVTDWTFDTDGDSQGWQSPQQLTGGTVKGGALTALTSGDDPAFQSPAIKVAAKEFSSVAVRMKLQTPDGGAISDQGVVQLFWRTSSEPTESEEASEQTETTGDGQWHDYKFAVGGNAHWKNTITGLRFDPCSFPGVKVSIDSVRLQK